MAYGSRNRNGLHAYYLCRREFPDTGTGTGLSLSSAPVDRAEVHLIIAPVKREHIGLTLAAQVEIAAASALAASTRECQLEGLRFEAELARRRFMHADPEDRLVGAPLEADWNARPADLEAATRKRERRQRRPRGAGPPAGCPH